MSPEEVTITVAGTNDLTEASAMLLNYLIKGDKDLFEDLKDYEEEIEDFVDDFNSNAKYIKVYPATFTSINRAVTGSYYDDMKLLQIGVILLVLYSFVVLG
jgi:hypothetical protein